tara:strand:- start:20207 stop:22426 length:2220 start_codon:yes stop_codon:yes gene_type:complete
MDEIQGQTVKKTVKDDIRKDFKKPKAPDDFDSKINFLAYATKLFDEDLSYDKVNRDEAIEDAKFAVGKQWDQSVLDARNKAGKPVLTINRLPAFIAQIVGNRRMNETDIKVAADNATHVASAELREGLIRQIQRSSGAVQAFNKALENQVISAIGNFDCSLEYAYDDVFEQDICINAEPNPFSVVWDSQQTEPTGKDAGHVFQVDTMRREDFKREYPEATAGSDMANDTRNLGFNCDASWITTTDVRVVRMWRMRSRKRIVALLKADFEGDSQDVVDITDLEPEEFLNKVVTRADGTPVMREVDRKYAELYTITAADILEGPYELPIDRVPVFRVPAWEINEGATRNRFGLIRFLKDPQRLHNYWRSIIAEKLMNTPKSNWLASDESVEGRDKAFRESHLSDDPLLIYNAEGGAPPQRIEPAQIEASLINSADVASQDLREVSNLHQASMGMQSNEVSGKAIMARQRMGETGTIIYEDNLDLAILECGRVINQLIPVAYDTIRTIKVLGADGQKMEPVKINDETDKASVDITTGKYSVTTTTGPSYATKRQEASESMLNMVNAMPQTMEVAADKIVEAQDWPGAQEIARRLRMTLPAGIVAEEDMSEAQQQQLAQQAQQQAAEAEKEAQAFQIELQLKQAQAMQAAGLGKQAEARAIKDMASIPIAEFEALEGAEQKRAKLILDAMEAFTGIVGAEDAAAAAAGEVTEYVVTDIAPLAPPPQPQPEPQPQQPQQPIQEP